MALTHQIKKPIDNRFKFDRKHYLAAALAVLVAISGLIAQSDAGLDRGRARVTRAESGRPLTPASREAPEAIVSGYLRSRGRSSEVLTSLRVKGANAGANGVTHVRMEQEIDGFTVHGAYLKAAVNSNGELIHLIDRLYNVRSVRPSRIDAPQALRAAMAQIYPSESATFRLSDVRGNTSSFEGGRFFYNEPTVTAVALPLEDGTLARGWMVQTWTAKSNELYHTVVDGSGRVLDVESRTANESFRVYAEDPFKGGQTVVNGPGTWLSSVNQTTTNIFGPNAHAYLDADSNNAPDSGGTAVDDGNFLATADLTAAPTTAANRAVAVQNLFYLNNVVHDILLGHGFDVEAGNFQDDDPVNAEAQDGGGLDNANFSTPPDGSSPRMQMYLWSGTTPDGLATASGVDYGLYGSAFGPAFTEAGVTGDLANYVDGTAPIGDGCTSATVPLTGKIAVIDRGSCDFTVKVLNAQKAGAIGAVIVNNVASKPFGPGGSSGRVRIPSGMVSQADGGTLHGLANTTANLHDNPAPPLRVDGDLDADIVFHEYGHGLTWRMIGSMSDALAGAIGEGASDVNAFLINGDDRIGEYAFSEPLGIRRFPYINYPNTYIDVDGGEVHNDGEIYAAAMWRVLENYLAAGLTAADLHGDFVDGMNYTPASPAFEDMRDGMLESVSVAGSGRECLIWRGFADRGIGVGATGIVRGKRVIVTESFALPVSCPAP
jgi:extracellular elastinolytic metalloproteinase